MNRNNSRAIVLFGSFQLTVAESASQADEHRMARRGAALSFYTAETRLAARNYNFLPGGGLARVRVVCADVEILSFFSPTFFPRILCSPF